ncbi:hypothetical protein AB0C34_01625 [Nocardia sp. NPDC049220]|uniref:hypothetical protein n=1 Tax=Nocardia sp. NPDC049220 TaxID=3155273 RepID=UPI0033DBDB27
MLTPRELAAEQFGVARSMGRTGVFGISRTEVDRERLATAKRAEAVIVRALAGPPKQFLGEPDNAQLNLMLSYVRARLAELEARGVGFEVESSPTTS